MTCLIFTYTDWQARIIEPLRLEMAAKGENLFWIGRQSKPVTSRAIRGLRQSGGLRGFSPFESEGSLPLLKDPIGFEKKYLSDYLYQMARYSKGYATNAHDLIRFHEYRDHFHLTARKLKRLLIRENITSLLFVNMPHTGDDYLLYRLAEDMGLKVTILFTTPFDGWLFSTTGLESFGRLNTAHPGHIDQTLGINILDEQIKQSVKSYMDGTYREDAFNFGEYLFAVKTLLTRTPRTLLSADRGPAIHETIRLLRGMKKRRLTRREIGRGRKAHNFLRWLRNLPQDTNNLPQQFIYVPLHYQPEMTTAPMGGVYGDQALAIEQLAACLPDGFEIVVKENPMQGGYHREATFTDRLRQIERVRLMHPSVESALLADRATIVAAITGTAGWEAIRANKPCLCFGYAWYRNCPGVHQFTPQIDLQAVIDDPPETAKTQAFLNEILNRSHKGVIYEFFLNKAESDDGIPNQDTIIKLASSLLTDEQQTTFA